MRKKLLLWIPLLTALVSFILASNAVAQIEPNYYATITSVIPENSPMYTTAGHNWTLTFEALWSYGTDSGKQIENATAIIEVKNSQRTVEEISLNITQGTFSFNYSSSTADILTFTPTSITTHKDIKYSVEVVDSANNLYGLKSTQVVVWWDTFNVSLLSYDTSSLQNVAVTVNVTYLLLPEKGLSLPAWATHSNQTFLPKIIHDATVRINGAVAEETETGVFQANFSTIMSTTYVNVEVSQDGWTTTHTAFGFLHQANQQIWNYLTIFISITAFVVLIIHFALSRKTGNSSFRLRNFPFFGGVSLMGASFISLYWGIASLEGFLHTFEWLLFTVLCLLSFVFGFFSSVMVLKRKYQALAILAVNTPLIVNSVIVKSFLDMSQLSNPWLTIALSTVISILSAFFICNSDKAFENKTSEEESTRLV